MNKLQKSGIVLLLLLVAVFTLPRSQVVFLPQIENFESEFQCNIACAPLCSLLGSWKNVTGDNWDWTSDVAGTQGGTGPTFDHTYQTSAGHYVYVETSCNGYGYPNKRFDLVSSYYMLANFTGTIYLDYWYHMFGSTMGILHVDADTMQGQGPWIMDYVAPHTGNQNLWIKRQVDITPFVGKDSIRFRFRYISGSDQYGDVALDDIMVYQPQAVDMGLYRIVSPLSGCGLDTAEQLSVELINYSNADLQAGDTVRICYDINGGSTVCETFTLSAIVAKGAGIVLNFTVPVDMSNPGNYLVNMEVVQAGDTTTWNDKTNRTFEHIPVVAGYPQVDDFENGPGLWASKGLASSWDLGTPNKPAIAGAASGWNAWATNLYGKHHDGEQSYVRSGCYNFATLCRPELELQIWWDSEYGFDGTVLQYSLNGGLTWTRVGNYPDVTNPVNWYNHNSINGLPGNQLVGWTGSASDTLDSGGWVLARHNLVGFQFLPSVMFRVAFAADVSTKYDGVAFDDFVVFNGVYLGSDKGICAGDTILLSAGGIATDTYLWSTGATTNTINVFAPGKYWVRKSNASFCQTSDTINVISIGPGFPPALGPDATACGSYQINPGNVPGSFFAWNNGDSTPVATVFSTGNYWATVTSSCGVVQTDTINVTIDPLPPLSLGNDTANCGSKLLDAGTGASWLWSTGAATQTISADSSGTYSVMVTGANGCTKSDSVVLTIVPSPVVDLGPDTNICQGTSVCLTAGSGTGNTYLWNNGVTNSTLCITVPGPYNVVVTNSIGCSETDSVIISQPAPPASGIGIDSSNCPLIQFTDIGTGGNPTSWTWFFGDGGTSTQQNPVHDYSVAGKGNYLAKQEVMNNCGSDSSTGLVIINCEIATEAGAAEELLVYPNPNEGRFWLKGQGIATQEIRIEIVDPMGRVVYKNSRRASGNWEEEISVPEAASGVYMLRINMDGETIVHALSIR